MASGPGVVGWTIGLTAFNNVAPGPATKKAKIALDYKSAIQQAAGLCLGKFVLQGTAEIVTFMALGLVIFVNDVFAQTRKFLPLRSGR